MAAMQWRGTECTHRCVCGVSSHSSVFVYIVCGVFVCVCVYIVSGVCVSCMCMSVGAYLDCMLMGVVCESCECEV